MSESNSIKKRVRAGGPTDGPVSKWTQEEVRQIAELTKKIGKAIGTADPRIAAAACLAVIDLSCSLVSGGANEKITMRSTPN